MKLLILDLDETLIYAVESPLDREHDFQSGHYYVYKRPGLDRFIQNISSLYDLAVWTSSNVLYAESVVPQLIPASTPLSFVWAQDRCTATFDPGSYTHEWAKNLNKVRRLGYDLENVLMVDDTPTKLTRHYGNLVRVNSFLGDPLDNELELLQRYLVSVAGVANVRQVEKRNWRSKATELRAP
jgi:RNA polymerase II subunit A small phosphatase-like protein